MPYMYYSIHRPVAPGTIPKLPDNNVVNIRNFDSLSYIEVIKREAWGYIEYEKPLCKKDAYDYELVPAVPDDEDKSRICFLLGKVLKMTRAACDIVDLKYNAEDERVTAIFARGAREINVEADSGFAMIKDIINHLGC